MKKQQFSYKYDEKDEKDEKNKNKVRKKEKEKEKKKKEWNQFTSPRTLTVEWLTLLHLIYLPHRYTHMAQNDINNSSNVNEGYYSDNNNENEDNNFE